jgi:hypothetical protein
MRGRLTLLWGEIINDHLSQNDIANMTAEKWGTQLVQINWQHILQLWYLRNRELHGETKEEQEKKRHQEMIN